MTTPRQNTPAPPKATQQSAPIPAARTTPVTKPPVSHAVPSAEPLKKSLTEPPVPAVEKPIPAPIVPEPTPAPDAQKPTAVPVAAASNISESQSLKKPEQPDSSDDDILFKHLEMLRDLKTNRQENT